MLPDPTALLRILIMAALPLGTAGVLIRRGKPGWGLLFGFALVIVLEAYGFWSMNSSSQACIRETCLAAGRPPDCEPYLGCTEGNGMLSLLYWGAGITDGILLAAAAIWSILRRRTKQALEGSGTSS